MKKIICIALCIISAAYSFWYASLGGFSGNDGALSKIGLEHPVLFAIWGILTFAALSANIITGYMKTKYNIRYVLQTRGARIVELKDEHGQIRKNQCKC